MQRAQPALGRIDEPPRGAARLRWLGPGLLWMVAAAGSGELLFTPRVGSLYGYALLWALLAAVALKWFINREVGRYTVCTGESILEGFARLPGPRGWAVAVILVPQLVVAVASIAGLAGAAATALQLIVPWSPSAWMIAVVLAAGGLVLWGRYALIEQAAKVVAVALALAAIAAAVAVGPDTGALARGLVPAVPEDADVGELLPWVGFALSGAAGMVWYSFWLRAKHLGAAKQGGATAPQVPDPADEARLRGWIRQLTLDNTVAVVGVTIVTLAFLILGTELLRPRGLVPEEQRVAEILGKLLGDVWGPVGFWGMVVALFVGFWSTTLSDQDGFARMFANGTRQLAGARLRTSEETLRRGFVVGLVVLAPIALYLAVGQPVRLLKLAGAIEAAHLPFLAVLAVILNRRRLPPALRPSWPAVVATSVAALFFAVFAVVYVAQLLG